MHNALETKKAAPPGGFVFPIFLGSSST